MYRKNVIGLPKIKYFTIRGCYCGNSDESAVSPSFDVLATLGSLAYKFFDMQEEKTKADWCLETIESFINSVNIPELKCLIEEEVIGNLQINNLSPEDAKLWTHLHVFLEDLDQAPPSI